MQPIISSASSSKEAWERLLHSYANASQSRIISLKSKFAKNPKGNKSVVEFLNGMRSIADELALIQNPISEEDLVVHIITQLGDEFNSLVAAIKVRESPITYSDLFDKLTDFERMLKEKGSTSLPIIPTVNVTQRKLAKFLRENNISFVINSQSLNAQQSPVANATTATSSMQQPWLFNSGASHHVTSNLSSLQTYADYGGPDEIFLGDGNSHPISHTGFSHGGASTTGGEHR
uniref:Putative zinc finger, CCHC-type n=1 Tax=Tanacetum cinerariifolium TaxID=118510 RepID=A0A6L2JBW2_TANCI|nr:putative zinc finger, CCHC-type [Tanacetum cinerariifolium]